MKARSTHFNNRTRPPLWSALLSSFVALSLIASPSQLCALMELTPGHSDSASHSHAAPSSYSHGDSHKAASDTAASGHHDSSHHHAGATHHKSSVDMVSPLPTPHACCPDGAAMPVIAVAPSRSAAPDPSANGVLFVPATLPATQGAFAFAHCFGRDGPSPGQPLHSQFLLATLLGRAPPVSA